MSQPPPKDHLKPWRVPSGQNERPYRYICPHCGGTWMADADDDGTKPVVCNVCELRRQQRGRDYSTRP